MRRIGAFLLLALLMSMPARGQNSEPWAVFSGDGAAADIHAIASRAADVDVVLVGELHDDTLGHRFKHELLQVLSREAGRPVTLSLEMFERDVQLVVDEYLAGMITEAHFRASARPWPNYERDYRPLVEFARAHRLPVVAANPPRRYVNAVSRGGLTALDSLFTPSRAVLPPLPLPEVPAGYRQTFFERIEGMIAHGGGNGPDPENLLAAQRLWDAGMAEAIARRLDRSPGTLVMHAAGAFHVEAGHGIGDMLPAYRPNTSTLIIAVRPGENFEPGEHARLGDFVVLTRHP